MKDFRMFVNNELQICQVLTESCSVDIITCFKNALFMIQQQNFITICVAYGIINIS